MKNLYLWITLIAVVLLPVACSQQENVVEEAPSTPSPVFKNYDGLREAQVMVVGTKHFDETVLESDSQIAIDSLIAKLANFHPTKIVLEWEPHRQTTTNERYRAFLSDSFDISQRPNEVYQLGFRLGKHLGHDSLFLFDDQTPFIGSLEGFTFDGFLEHAEANDTGFYDRYLDSIKQYFTHNQEVLSQMPLDQQIAWLNAPEKQRINAQRMHMLEVRVGIQDSWMGPDWVGRFYQRNTRMMANVLKITQKGDRILIIVGDNHKWILDTLFGFTPDFELVSSWEMLQ